jgi:hypothetical protein
VNFIPFDDVHVSGVVGKLERRLPDAIILGVMKCGTITLGLCSKLGFKNHTM